MTVLERARAAFVARAWSTAHDEFSCADRSTTLDGSDLEAFAVSAYLVGREDEYLQLLQRAHRAHARAGAEPQAARTAFWLGLRLLFRGEQAQANGWFARVRRAVEAEPGEHVEEGYLLLAETQQHLAARHFDRARETATTAEKFGERFTDADLVTVARHLIGLVHLQEGDLKEGIALLDEAMVAVAGGELSPIVTGLVYCSVIDGYRDVHAIERAGEWTRKLSAWCDEQPQMLAFTGVCSVHRAELLEFHGSWTKALLEAERAATRCQSTNRSATGAAFYRIGELRRLRGEFAAAEEAYLAASQWEHEPQPGISLLALSRGQERNAAASIHRALDTARECAERARLLPAYVEIMISTGRIEDAKRASLELRELGDYFDARTLRARAAHAQGEVELAEASPQSALQALRSACKAWQELDAPYLLARVRVLTGLCCKAVGDEQGCRLELRAARALFERIGAVPDLDRLDTLTTERVKSTLLSPRELTVLRLVARGTSNKSIAATLSLSEKTVERHVSNIFAKLDVRSRTAAAAYAYEHRLIGRN